MLFRQAGRGLVAHRAAVTMPNRHISALRVALLRLPSFERRIAGTRLLRPMPRPGLQARHDFLPQDRPLATTTDDFKLNLSTFDPLDGALLAQFQATSQRPLDLPHFDPSLPLTIPEPRGPRPMTKMNLSGIPGETEDMLAIFDACIRVGKLGRAALVLTRFNVIGTLSAEELILLNNQYLRASLNQLLSKPSRNQTEELHKWYELQIRSRGLPHTVETVACMLKASLLSERGARLHRLIKRYMGMAPGEAGLRVLNMAEILTDTDLATITEICPTYNFSEEADLHDQPAPETQNETDDRTTDAPAVEDANVSPSEFVPELLETEQRGAGLAALKQGLQIFTTLQDVKVSTLSPADQREIQLLLERDCISSAIARWREDRKKLQRVGKTSTLGTANAKSTMSQHMASWLCAMEPRLEEEMRLITVSENKATKVEEDLERCFYGPFLRQSSPDRLAVITILTVLNLGAILGSEKGVTVSRLMTSIARLVQEDIEMQQNEEQERIQKRKKRLQIKEKCTKAATSGKEDSAIEASCERGSSRKVSNLLELRTGAQEDIADTARQPWSLQIKSHVGSILLKILLETAKIKVTVRHPKTKELVSQYQPAFTHQTQPRKGRKVGVVFLNSEVTDQLKREPMGDFIAKHLPMLVEPKSWSRTGTGGFLASKTKIVRVKSGNDEQRLYVKAAIKCGNMDQVFKGLDVLGKMAWRVNINTLNVMMEAWNSGEKIANLPPLNPHFEIPEEPDPSADPLVRHKWIQAVRAIENERTALHSQRCFMNLQLEIARAFRHQTMYFPHNVDYRGRAYPIPPYLNHMGADNVRSLLVFAKGKELGRRGLRWLKIHLANVYGLDKSSFDEREGFVNDNLDNIADSALKPLEGRRWWLEAEDPWQCLSACFELKAAMDLPDPKKFVSHLPVHQDGTCNGLQHYAALGGDTWGAKQVNLEPGDRPADVYSAVADLVKQAITKDAADDNIFGKILDGKVTRKVVKQTVMTNVYGVTFDGAKKQVCKQIDALYPDLAKEHGIPNIILSTYIAKLIFDALATMFRGAHDIQYWLGEIGGRACRALTSTQLDQIAKTHTAEEQKEDDEAAPKKQKKTKKRWNQKELFEAIEKQFRSTIVWTTPLRMPVVQPYRKGTTREIRTCLQAVVYNMDDQTDQVNRRKQLQGFPPNFIHSLDASHMILSALRCHELGLTFAAVHDSFWTHASDVDTMNGVLREAFIRVHKEDVVGRLATEFRARHKGSLYLAHIDSTTAVAKKIQNWREKHNYSPEEELLLEHKRNTLMLSGKENDITAAKNIQTPASLYEGMAAAEADISIQEDTKAFGIGEIPEGEDRITAKDVQEECKANTSDITRGSTEMTKRLMKDMNKSHFEVSIAGGKPRAQAASSGSKLSQRVSIPLWLPLTIPDIPKKGDFDVERLRESTYFFS